ncbi:MAG TPA: BamA/TamA family outer membrane protein [Aquabacterium sp.]|nr:BamA/TamA family outer membrane protein [Aquabacterium sp.]
MTARSRSLKTCLLCLCWGVSLAGAAWAQDAPPVAAPSGEVSTALPASDLMEPQPLWRLDIDAPEKFRKLLRNYLDLARFQSEGQVGGDQINLVELRRLVVSAPEQARGLLEAEGYFSAKITTRVADASNGQPMVVTIKVEPGPLTRVSKVQMIFEGELDTRLSNGDEHAQALVQNLEDTWGLQEGRVFKQAEWSAAKNATLAKLRAMGYPTASWSGTSVTVDADAKSAKLFLVADSGPAFFYGDIRVEGLHHQPASAITNLAPFKPGDPYQEAQLVDLQDRIQKINLFDNVFVTTDVDPTSAAAVPVVVQVHEMPLQQASVGVGISSDTGPRVSFEHLHRQPFDSNWQAKTKLQVGRDDSNLQLDLTSHPWPGRQRGLISGLLAYQIDDSKAVTTSQRWRVGRLRELDTMERTDYLEFQHAKVKTEEGVTVSRASSLAGTSQWIFRNVDSQVLPTKGVTTTVSATFGHTFSTLDASGYFGRGYARLTGYLPLPWNWYSSARAEWGQVIARDSVSVPDTLLFRAGGDESVRGYAYRSLGVQSDGVTIGGRSLVTGSFELAHRLTRSMPNLLGAVFVDGGDAAANPRDLHIKLGYGVGLRFRSPVGPLKLDVAYGRDVQQIRVHFSVGISL